MDWDIDWKTTFKNYVRLGTHFGYPPCCISYFCELSWLDEVHGLQKRVLGKGGWVLCPECQQKEGLS